LPRQSPASTAISNRFPAAYFGAAFFFGQLPDRITEKIMAFSCAISYMKKCYSDFYYALSHILKCLYMVIKIKPAEALVD
jgi:hypothetical protein